MSSSSEQTPERPTGRHSEQREPVRALRVRRPHGPTLGLREAGDRLRAAHAYLRSMGAERRAALLARVGAAWCRVETPPIATTIRNHAEAIGYSESMLRWGLPETFGRWRRSALLDLVRAEAGSVAALDRAQVPPVVLMVLAATVPPAGLQSVALALLAGCSVIVRPAARLVPLVESCLGSLRELAPALADAVVIAETRSDDAAAIDALGGAADAVVVHGGDRAVAAWQRAARDDALTVGYGHRISAAALGAGVLRSADALTPALEGLALDLCAWDQTGCLSPHVLFVQTGETMGPSDVAEQLAHDALPSIETRLAPAERSLAEAAQRNSFVRGMLVEAESVESPGGAVILVCDRPGTLEAGPGGRVLVVRPFETADELIDGCAVVAPRLQAMALAGFSDAVQTDIVGALSPAGLNYVCGPGRMQRPPLGWHHDGIGSIAPLIQTPDD